MIARVLRARTVVAGSDRLPVELTPYMAELEAIYAPTTVAAGYAAAGAAVRAVAIDAFERRYFEMQDLQERHKLILEWRNEDARDDGGGGGGG